MSGRINQDAHEFLERELTNCDGKFPCLGDTSLRENTPEPSAVMAHQGTHIVHAFIGSREPMHRVITAEHAAQPLVMLRMQT